MKIFSSLSQNASGDLPLLLKPTESRPLEYKLDKLPEELNYLDLQSESKKFFSSLTSWSLSNGYLLKYHMVKLSAGKDDPKFKLEATFDKLNAKSRRHAITVTAYFNLKFRGSEFSKVELECEQGKVDSDKMTKPIKVDGLRLSEIYNAVNRYIDITG